MTKQATRAPSIKRRKSVAAVLGILLICSCPFAQSAPTVEWQMHRSSAGAHPNGSEQEMLWLMNRAREHPPLEGRWLAFSDDPDVAGGRTYFQVDIGMLQAEFDSYVPMPPAAFDMRLYAAARIHANDLIERDASDHDHQFDRIDDQGFRYRAARGNVFSYAKSPLNAHAAFNIDWGGNDDGTISVSADTGQASLPVRLDVCPTDPQTAACIQPPASRNEIPVVGHATPSFSIFATATGPVPFDPAANRIFVRFSDGSGALRGSTSVAVRTE